MLCGEACSVDSDPCILPKGHEDSCEWRDDATVLQHIAEELQYQIDEIGKLRRRDSRESATPEERRPEALPDPEKALRNAVENYKGLWDIICNQVVEMCKYLGGTDDMMLDSWTLRDLIIETKRRADSIPKKGDRVRHKNSKLEATVRRVMVDVVLDRPDSPSGVGPFSWLAENVTLVEQPQVKLRSKLDVAMRLRDTAKALWTSGVQDNASPSRHLVNTTLLRELDQAIVNYDAEMVKSETLYLDVSGSPPSSIVLGNVTYVPEPPKVK